VKATFVMHVFPRNLKPQDLKTGAKSKTECIFFPRSRHPPEDRGKKKKKSLGCIVTTYSWKTVA